MATPRRILVTGAAGGIGTAVCKLLRQQGEDVIAWDIAPGSTPVDNPVDNPVDLTDPAATAAAVATLLSTGPIDALIHTAGVLHPDSALDASPTLAQSLAVNLHGVVNVCAPVAQAMINQGHGSIVAITSNAASTPRRGMASYCASKAAAAAWLRTLALECAPHGVRCNSVSPGSTDTDMLRQLGATPAGSIAGSPADFRLGIPLGRVAQPEDVAAAAIFLISPAARHITMHDLRVDGGATFDS